MNIFYRHLLHRSFQASFQSFASSLNMVLHAWCFFFLLPDLYLSYTSTIFIFVHGAYIFCFAYITILHHHFCIFVDAGMPPCRAALCPCWPCLPACRAFALPDAVLLMLSCSARLTRAVTRREVDDDDRLPPPVPAACLPVPAAFYRRAAFCCCLLCFRLRNRNHTFGFITRRESLKAEGFSDDYENIRGAWTCCPRGTAMVMTCC